MTETIGSVGLEDPETYIRQTFEELLNATPDTEMERAVWAATVATARSGLDHLARLPLVITVAWPAGMNKAQRQTIRAQLDSELRGAHLRRLAEELRILLTLSPGIAMALCALAGSEEAQQAAMQSIKREGRLGSLMRRISAALKTT